MRLVHGAPALLWLWCLQTFSHDGLKFGALAAAAKEEVSGSYISLQWMDNRRVLMRVPSDAALPPAEEELMLDELAIWKWRVEHAAAGAAVLVTFSHCPHGLGLMPVALDWQGGGQWRSWPGMFEYARGAFAGLVTSGPGGWQAISESAACEGTAGVAKLGQATNVGLEACQAECKKKAGCQAVDYYRATRWCNLYNKPCTSPSKNHDQASSWRYVVGASGSGKTMQEMSFLAAKQWCQQTVDCKGFSYSGVWSDKDREAGVARQVHFAVAGTGDDVTAEKNWHSYVRRDSPRANCNPEGQQFECPQNPYACLGLSMDADDSSVKQAFRSLSRRMHPDKIPKGSRTAEAVKKAEAAFRDISESHETILDPRKRRQADQRLRQQRQKWEEQKASVQDIYIKEPQVSSLEPESYAELIPKAQEWLVHFFLPANNNCKQMKMAMGRVVQELGTGEAERDPSVVQPKSTFRPGFPVGRIFRGRLRDKGSGLRTEGAGFQDGDTHIVLVVTSPNAGRLYVQEEGEVEVKLTDTGVQNQKYTWQFEGGGRLFAGSFDRSMEFFRGTIAVDGKEVASFALQQDLWQPIARGKQPLAGRQKPRLFGAVNCGRFPDFCKRKGADPARHHFPQVRVLFPDEMRFEAYSGRPLGRDVAAFTYEATRPAGDVRQLDLAALASLQSMPPSPWLLLLLRSPAAKKGNAAQDCPLCRASLPMLRRAVPQLERGNSALKAGWVNCTADAELCNLLGGEDSSGSSWGSLQLVRLGGQGMKPEKELNTCTGCELLPDTLRCQQCTLLQSGAPLQQVSVTLPVAGNPLWDPSLLPGGEIGQQNLLVALEAAVRTADLMTRSSSTGASGPSSRAEL